MAQIIKIYTQEQLYNMYRNKILADNVGLTDFNAGSKVRSLLESNSDIVASISMDFKEALYNAIPIALYQGFGFAKKGAVAATGYIRPYRKPAFYITYSGSGTSALLNVSSTTLSVSVTGAPGDAFSLDLTTYTMTSDVVDAINLLSNWSAVLVKDVASDTLHGYSSVEIIGAINYLNASGLDIMLATDTAITILTGYSVTINGLQVLVTEDTEISDGESGAQCPAQFTQTGVSGNINANAIDTLNGLGYINSTYQGIDHVINDSAFSGGSDEETETERQQRFLETVNALNAGTKPGILSAIKAITGIRSVGMRAAYPYKGANTILVDTGTGSISPALLAEIEQVLYGNPDDLDNYPGKNAEGIEYSIVVPTIVDVNIGITAYRLPTVNVDLDEIKLDVKSAIEQYVNTRKLGEDVLLSEIIRVSKNSNAAVYDVVITSPATNISISDDEFAKTGAGTGGTVTVTMVIATNI